jgi:hypothetical protein
MVHRTVHAPFTCQYVTISIHYHVWHSLTSPRTQTFNRQFKEWGFPRRWKTTKPEDEARYLERIKQLWEQSLRSGEIASIMHDEGFNISEQRISRLRRKYGLVLRGERDFAGPANQKQTNDSDLAGSTAPDSHQVQDVFNTVNDFSGLQQQHTGMMSIGDMPYQTGYASHVAAPVASSTAAQKRTQNMLDDDEERPQTKKRRRLLRGMGPTPPDAPGMPPRYKSETSLNECKAYLQLDNERYQTLREQFTDICNEMGIIKKTKCEPGQWETAKDRLIRANLHLNAVMNIPHPSPHEVANALEVICADVTKKIRVTNTKISVGDANKGLQLNPAESKQIRHLFYQMLEQEGYTTMVEFGNERYNDIFQLWLTKSDILVRIQQQGMDAHKMKCLKVLSRDAQKRLCDSRLKVDPQKRMWVEGSYGPGPAAARPRVTKSAEPKQPKTPKRKRGQDAAPTTLDPSLAVFAPAPPVPSPIPLPVDAEFRLAPESRLVGYHPKVWTARLEKCTVPGLHKAGTGKTGAARVGKLFGIVKTSDGRAQEGIEGIEAAAGGLDEGEDKYAIESDNDLVAYLHTAKELAGEKLVFLIELSGGYA